MPFGDNSGSWTSSDRCGDKVNLHHQGEMIDSGMMDRGAVYGILRLEVWGF